MLLTSTFEVYVAGLNVFGQLGLGSITQVNYPFLLPNFKNITEIIPGSFHSFLFTRENDKSLIFGTGDNLVFLNHLIFRLDNFV